MIHWKRNYKRHIQAERNQYITGRERHEESHGKRILFEERIF
jgi:predicted secreted Zn-dependent protease